MEAAYLAVPVTIFRPCKEPATRSRVFAAGAIMLLQHNSVAAGLPELGLVVYWWHLCDVFRCRRKKL